jgi:DNA-directed RNA polymerase sigma subunit (sigma70/sigma32)
MPGVIQRIAVDFAHAGQVAADDARRDVDDENPSLSDAPPDPPSFQARERDARRRLIDANLRPVISITRRHRHMPVPQLDLIEPKMSA